MLKHFLLALAAAAGSASAATVCDDSMLAADPKAIQTATWAKMITDVGQEKTATQKMVKAFLFIKRKDISGYDVSGHVKNLKKYIYAFDDVLSKLLTGTGGYAAPPLMMICSGLADVEKYWPNLRSLVYPATDANYVIEDDEYLMGNLSYWGYYLAGKVESVEQMYVSVTQFYSPSTPGKTIELAERQSMLTQQMTKQALFIAEGFDVAQNLESLQEALGVFDTTHEGLLKGITEIQLAALQKRCTIWAMRTVSDYWGKLKPPLQRTLDTETADLATVREIELGNLNLLNAMNAAVALFVKDDDTACDGIESSLSFAMWANGINEAGRGQMFSQKSARLILQIAQPNPANLKVDQDELVDTLDTGLWTLNTLIEGSVTLNVPALPTQILVEQFVANRETWKQFQSTLNNNAQNLPISADIVDRVAVLRETYFDSMAGTIDTYVNIAKEKAPSVHSEVIFIAGRQRSLQCKLASESLLIDLDCRPEHHRKLAQESIDLYMQVHWRLLLGEKDAEGNVKIKRTTNICMLNQMLAVIDSYSRIRGITGLIMESSRDTSSKADLQSFHEIINAGYGIMNAAVEMYIADGATCTLQPQSEEWDFVINELSNLRTLIERVTKDFLFTMKGQNTTDGDIYLPGSLAELSETMNKLTYGSTADLIPTPPSQAAADKLFAVTDVYKVWESKVALAPDATQDDVLAVVEQGAQLSEHVQALMNLYIDDAWEKDKTVEAARLNASGSLAMAVELAQKQVALLQVVNCAPCTAQGSKLADTITMFEDTYQTLRYGNEKKGEEGSRRLTNRTKTGISETVDNNLITMLTDMRTKWNVMKPVLEQIAEAYSTDGDVPSVDALVEAADKAKAVGVAARASSDAYSTSSRTTTSVPLDVLTPLPLTGAWTAGRTMRTAARFAETMINYQQKVMPGFAIKNRFFDDRCDDQEGMRLVLQESASVLTDYVALGGMGCTEVCANAAFAAASMNMPFLSYECNGRELSDEAEYAGFTRMGTPLTQSLDMFEQLTKTYGWRQVTIVSADPAKYRPQVEYYQSGLLAAGVATSYFSSFDSTFEETLSMVNGFVAEKQRVIMMIGDESFMRRVVCGSRVANANLGITWLYEGILSKQWWTVDDASLVAEQPTCTGVGISESFQGAINFAGLGKALPNEQDLPLDCFEGETSTTFLQLLDQHLTDGYPTVGDNETQVARPHMELRAHSADGVCALAKTMAHFLIDHTVDELRNPTTAFYQEFVNYMKTGLAFQGVSGWVNFTGNDKPETISMKQVRGEDLLTIGMAFPNGSMQMDMNGGLTNDSWAPAKEDAKESFPWLVFKVITPLLCVCCPAIAGCIRQG